MTMDLLASMGMSGVPLLAAMALGLLMAISPCTLATSVAAVMFIVRDPSGRWRLIATGVLYTLGRLVVYTALAAGIVWFGLNTREIAVFLQQYGERLLAPVLILAGLWMLGFAPRMKWPEEFDRVYKRLFDPPERRSGLSAFLLGVFFSLSFCPINIVIFFGLLVPLAYRSGDAIGVPAVFALASTLPVLIASLILVTSARQFGRMLVLLQDVNLWMQRAAGFVFLAAGVYYIPRFLGF
ncbi:MAG: aromatic aminobenezylarsenical efflux permease ArsG family transporter [Methanoregula sp.]|nr:aromatic aminobenezylarsenical efflux permease ArsG family transporter [Methanoregula sp.]